MTQQHFITPPPELVVQWIKECSQPDNPRWQEYEQDIAARASQWGADQELEACCEWGDKNLPVSAVHYLRAARRPKPPSLKEQALLAIDTAVADYRIAADVADVVRRALEQLPDNN
jgi:hypothetical protein